MVTPVLRSGRLTTGARQLGRSALSQVRAVLEADPVATCLVASRFEQVGMDPQLLGGTFWGVGGGRSGLCFAGANLTPLSGDDRAMGQIARKLGRRERACASVVGPADLAMPLWESLAPFWGPAREIRAEQPLLVCPDPPACPIDPRVERVEASRLDAYYPAAVAMFAEEVGVDPRTGDGGRNYRARVAGLLSAGRAFARFEGDEVVFKAEIGALSSRVALIQGVWVHPDLRGQGQAATGTAAVVAAAQRLGRLPSLYVNEHNVAARAAYHRVGFARAGTFASVMF
jgi:predicted GNAT family acetyltransferase